MSTRKAQPLHHRPRSGGAGRTPRVGTAPRHALALLAALALAATAAPAWDQPEPFGVKTYLDAQLGWALAPQAAPQVKLAPFVREESRFREAGLVFVKTFAGARVTVLPWLHAATYYAHKDLQYTDHKQAHMAVLDVFVQPKIGPFVLWDKNGFEVHITDGFFRYRNALELRWASPLGWLVPFVRGELRVDSDAARVNMLDAWAGAVLRLSHRDRANPSLRLFYGYETKRRGKPTWSGVHLVAAAFAAHF